MIRSLADEEIERVLQAEVVGRIGCHAAGRTYVVPVSYVYADGAVCAHSGDGLKIRMMRQNPDVCFEVDHVEDLVTWNSAICWGTYEELTGADAWLSHPTAKELADLSPVLEVDDIWEAADRLAEGRPADEVERSLTYQGTEADVAHRIVGFMLGLREHWRARLPTTRSSDANRSCISSYTGHQKPPRRVGRPPFLRGHTSIESRKEMQELMQLLLLLVRLGETRAGR